MFLTRAPRRPTQAPTGIDLRVVGMDGDLGAVAGLAGDAADFHGAVGDFADLGLEQAPDEIRVAAGQDDLRARGLVFDRHHVGADPVADVVFLGRHPLPRRHHALELAEVDHHIAALEAADRARHDVAGAVLELLVDHLLLGLAQALHHRLLGRLRRDPPEILRRHVELHRVAGLAVRIAARGQFERHFVELVGVIVVRRPP